MLSGLRGPLLGLGIMLCPLAVCRSQSATEHQSLAPLAASTRIAVQLPVQGNASRADSVPAEQQDTYLGPDKVKHFLLSAFIEAVGFSGMRKVGASRGTSLAVATAATAATGVGKEIHDGITKGLFSFGDLTWDAVGIGAGLLLISHSQR